jgi:hypothetical protein
MSYDEEDVRYLPGIRVVAQALKVLERGVLQIKPRSHGQTFLLIKIKNL